MWSDASERYKTEIADIFSEDNKLMLQLYVEISLANVQANIGIITKEEAERIRTAADNVKIERVKEIEKEIHHDVMAMVKALAEQAGEAGERVHLGATSTDIQDTVLAMQMAEAKRLILNKLDLISETLYILSDKYKSQITIGRTHGQHAVPTTTGFKFANFLYELQIVKEDLLNTTVAISKFSGAVGNYASSGRMDIESKLFELIELKPTEISTQVVSRVFHAKFMSALALCASVIEKMSKEIRNLQRTEIQEWFEPFTSKQVGSSAMPHKRNPHKSERISGLARIIRNNVSVALENISLEHERDISHSSVERVIIPESANLLFYIADQMNIILSNIEINEENITRNLKITEGKIQSEQLLAKISNKIGRQAGHELLRSHLMSENFKKSVSSDAEILKIISKEEIHSVFNTVTPGLAVEKTERICKQYKNEWMKYRS